MCGIAGWLFTPGAEPPAHVLEQMAWAIQHRGPDDHGEFRDGVNGVALAHRRLSIIDLSGGSHQPIIDAETRVVLVYNGELYNFRSLRGQLQALGHQFLSLGDSEVVLRSYLQWGTECFVRFAGMFALAIWDPRSRCLHFARDPMGMKPLYYVKFADGVAFGSEIKVFCELPGFKMVPAQRGLRQYLEFGYVFDEDQTFLDGVLKLPAGCRMELKSGAAPRIDRFFTPCRVNRDDRRAESERIDELGEVLDVVTAEHLIADVPLGLLLSGGLDSSLVAALAVRHAPLLTISMGFADSPVDERPLARQVSKFIGSEHLEILITPEQVMAEVSEGAWVFDDLFADWGTITTRLMYRRCREHGIKVVLVGEGADELFGGYDVFNTPPDLNLWRLFRLYQRYSGRRHGKLFRPFQRIMADYLEASEADSFDAVRLFESRRQLPNQYVMKVDKASMAESIEARAPYLDRRIAQLAYGTPREWLLRGGENKYLLRALARRERLLPENISGRPKFGASVAATWIDDNPVFRRFARERLLSGSWVRRLGFEPAMRAYFDGGRQGYGFPHGLSIFNNLAWRLLLLELWGAHYLTSEVR